MVGGSLEIIEPLDRIRERSEPFRDDKGRIVHWRPREVL